MSDQLSGPEQGAALDALAALFAEALELDDSSAQHALLASVRARDPALAAELASLLEAHSADPSFLAEPLVGEVAGVLAAQLASALVGTQVGGWEVDAVLHHGGMGTVYRAHRVGVDFEQHAALKVIRHGLGSPELVRRFAQERRLLARLEHPNIARLLDGGTTAEDLPYLVMDYVRGEMIDVWSARQRPSLDRLLDVFTQICSAVNFAHQNLVVHRDIKPANILVTPDGTAKLLDFGIAELERQAATEPDAESDGRLLTPGYASPEQFRGGEVGTTTDTYSLGVLLYRLLTDETPYRIEPGSSAAEAERIVLEAVPAPPSAVLAARGARLPRRAADLDAIVLRALRKEPAERYPSVQAFADDLRRYAEGAPVDARPATVTYRAARFAGRHWKGLAVAATIVGLLIGGLSAALWQAGVAERQRDLARAEAATAASAVTFLKTVLGSADPWRDTEPAETVDDVIRLAEAEVDSVLSGEPAARAYVLSALGQVAAGRGQLDRADRMTGAAVAILEGSGAAGNARAGTIYLTRSLALHEDGRLQDARTFAAEAVRQFESGEDNAWAELAGALNQLGALDIELGDHTSAETTLRRAVALHQANGEQAALGLAGVYNNLAVALANQPGRLEEAAGAYAEATRLVERVGASAPRLATLLVNQANAFRQLGRIDQAETTFDRAIALMTQSLGPAHQSTLTAAGSLASLYEATGKFEQAAATLRVPLESARAALPSGHPTTAYLQNVLGAALCQMDRPEDHRQGLAVSRASLDARVAAMGPGHWAVASGQSIVGHCLVRLGRREEGLALLRRAVATLRAERGEDQELTVRARRWLEQVE
ncbi:MAG: tetratricopeptide repeat protein [Gemmatimonadales bacterium]|nr:tetratricopeptide repeat protein [Gemmatimonadales bacterium]